MLAITRKSKIRDIILEKKSITVVELSKLFSVTEETIRRDLKALEDENFLTRTYGGAFIQDGVENDVNLSLREAAYIESKQIIAKKCLSLIRNGDSIFLDISTTALHIAKAIKNLRLTVLTNSLMIINVLAEYENIRLISIGGNYAPNSRSFTGKTALTNMNDYFVDKCFISCRSVCINNGVSDSNEINADIRQKAIERSNQTYLICDHSKFNKTSFIHICDFKELSGIVTDAELSEEWKEFLTENNVQYYSN
jgi:DeoR/GlpR family transcriptional regulator of sugar metabolism